MNGDNSWVIWLVAAGFFAYWLAQTNLTTAANLNQVGVPPGTKVSGSNVLNAQGQIIGTITAAGYYIPNAPPAPATANPLGGTSANPAAATTGANSNPLSGQNVTSSQFSSVGGGTSASAMPALGPSATVAAPNIWADTVGGDPSTHYQLGHGPALTL